MSDNVQAWLSGVMIGAERHGQACKVEWRGVDRAELDEGVTEVERKAFCAIRVDALENRFMVIL